MKRLLQTCAVLMMLLCMKMVTAQSPELGAQDLNAKDVKLEVRLADEEEMPVLGQDPCHGASPDRLECRPLALEVHNYSGHFMHLVHMDCNDFQVSVELYNSAMGSWYSPPRDPAPRALCGASAPQFDSIEPGGQMRRPFRIAWLASATPPLRGRPWIRVKWDMTGCVDDDPTTGCARNLPLAHSSAEAGSYSLLLLSEGISLLPGNSRHELDPGSVASEVVTSSKLQQSYWFVSWAGHTIHRKQEMWLSFHIRNLSGTPVEIVCAGGWPVFGPFEVRILMASGRLVEHVREHATYFTTMPPYRKSLERGEANDCSLGMEVNVREWPSGKLRLPSPGEYVVDVSPTDDPGTHLRYRFKLLAK